VNSRGIHSEQGDGLKQDDGQIFGLTIILLFSRTHFATSTCASVQTKMMVLRAGELLLHCCYPELNHAMALSGNGNACESGVVVSAASA
jgi:hypothetical protein